MEKIKIRQAKEKEIREISEFLETHFSTGNPLELAYVCADELEEEPKEIMITQFVEESIRNSNVLMAVDESSEQLVGLLICSPTESESDKATTPPESPPHPIGQFLDYVHSKAKICERFNLPVDQCFHIEIVGVHQEYRGQQIAKKLFESGFRLGKSKNYKLVSVDCTSVYSTRIAEKLEMEFVSSVTYDEFNSVLGKCAFVPVPPHFYVKTFVKKL